jgi:hypothetical protein
MFHLAATPIDFTPLKEALTASVAPADVITVIAGIVGLGMAFVLMWMGINKGISSFRAAVTRGRLKA